MATYKTVYTQTHPQTPKHVCKGKNEEIRRVEGTKYKIIAKSSTMTARRAGVFFFFFFIESAS